MAAITNPKTKVTEFSGVSKILSLNGLALTTASDALTLSFANNNIASITNIVASIETGADGNFATVMPSYSGLVITLTSKNATGATATNFDDADCTVNLLVVGT